MIETSTLENGLKIISETLPDSNYVTVAVDVASGTRKDIMPYKGLAHLLEHCLFLGTTTQSEENIRKIERTTGLGIDAETTAESISFSSSCLPKDFESLFSLMSDIILHPSFDEAQITREKKIVISEISEINLDIDEAVESAIHRLAFGNHPLGLNLHGNKSSVEAIRINHLKNYHHDNFRADNIIVSVVGDITHQQIKSLCAKLFENAPAATKQPPQSAPAYIGGSKHLDNDGQNIQFCLAFDGFPIQNVADYTTGRVLTHLLDNAFYDVLVREKGLLYDVSVQNKGYSDSGLFTVKGFCLPSKIRTVLKNCAAFIGNAAPYITEPRVQMAKKQLKLILNPYHASFEERAKTNAFDLRYFKQHVPWQEYEEAIDNISQQTLIQAAKRVFASKLTYCTLGDMQKAPTYNQIKEWICLSQNPAQKTLRFQTR